MPEEFEAISHDSTAVLDMPPIQEFHDKQEAHPGRFQLGMAAAGLALASAMGILASTSPAEATDYDPSASYAQKVQDIDVIAHRGLVGYYNGRKTDEDTIRACLLAIQKGAEVCEIDIQTPKHAKNVAPKPVIIHDETTNRVTKDCNLDVDTHTYKRLMRCHMNHGGRLSSLAAFAKAISPYRNRVSVIAEIKDRDATMQEMRTINGIFASNGFNASNLTYESFSGKRLRDMKRIAPSVDALLIKGNTTSPMRATSLPSAFDGIIIPYKAFVNGIRADSNFAVEYQERGEQIIPWGVQTVDQMRYVTVHGGTGFMSDHVGRARSLS